MMVTRMMVTRMIVTRMMVVARRAGLKDCCWRLFLLPFACVVYISVHLHLCGARVMGLLHALVRRS